MILAPPLDGPHFSLDTALSGRVEVYGAKREQGTPLLLVHSVNAAANAHEMRPFYEAYAKERPTYAFDLPGFGLSERSDRIYSVRLMTDAIHAVVAEIRRRHPGQRIDAIALSLGTEFLARAVAEEPEPYRSLMLVSPTGFNGEKERRGPEGATMAIPGVHAALHVGLWSRGLFALLTRPASIRFFLRKAFGRSEIDEQLFAYDVEAVKPAGARFAPLYFLSGALFSADIDRVYDALRLPVLMIHGRRGDFVDYRRAGAMRTKPNWTIRTLPTGALPQFERMDEIKDIYAGFLSSFGTT